MTSIKIQIEDNSDKFLKQLEEKMPEMLNATGNELYKSITNFMTEDDIIDTGRLKGSISYSTQYNNYSNPSIANKTDDFIKGANEKNTVVYGSNVEYASYVETGTSKQRARNYVKTGTTRAIPQIKKVVENILKGGQ